MNNNFRNGILVFLYMFGLTGTSAFFISSDSDSKVIGVIGIVALGIAIYWTYDIFKLAPKRAATAKQIAEENEIASRLKENKEKEKQQKYYASLSGLDKMCVMYRDYSKDLESASMAAMELGSLIENSVYQEKEKDWAIRGGIASGLAGPAAGVATAVKTMHENERIRAENEKQKEWGKSQHDYYNKLALDGLKKSRNTMSEYTIRREYAEKMDYSPIQLFKDIYLSGSRASINEKTGSVTVTTRWSSYGKTIIDGSLRAKLYTDDNKCVGCAYLVFPKNGTADDSGTLSGICAVPAKKAAHYSVKIEPIDLWNVIPKSEMKGTASNSKMEEHKRIVKELHANYEKELQ